MSFADPLWLLALALIPLVLAGERLWSGRAHRYAVRFTAVPSLVAAIGEGSSRRWRRWLGGAAFVLAIAALALALARPRDSYRVPIGDASLVLVLDHSGSMAATDVAPTRIQAAMAAGNSFIDELPAQDKVGLVAFGSTPTAVQRPVTDHDATKALLDSQVAGGGTDTGPALALALSLLDGADRHHPPSAIVLLSDGAANLGTDPTVVATQARRDGIPIDTVALGTPSGVLDLPGYAPIAVPPDPALMRAIAADSGGTAFDAKTAGELSDIYKHLGLRLGSVRHERDLVVWFVLAAAAFALVAVLLRVRMAVRLP